MPADAVSFPDWKQVLWRTDASPDTKAEFAREIITFLKYCKDQHARRDGRSESLTPVGGMR